MLEYDAIRWGTTLCRPTVHRQGLAAAPNSLLASPTFSSWRKGASLDVAEWVSPRQGRTPGVIVSVAHLDDEERQLVLGVVLEEILSYARGLPGTQELKTLVVFDEVYGYLPPHPANPPTKRPIVSLMKQARAFGMGVVIATQNPMDLDYRALSNAGSLMRGPMTRAELRAVRQWQERPDDDATRGRSKIAAQWLQRARFALRSDTRSRPCSW